MKRVLCLLPFASMLAFTLACGSDDTTADDDDEGASSSSSSSSSGAGASSSSGGGSSSSGGSSSGGSSSGAIPFECEDAPFVFPADASEPLDEKDYDDYLALDPAFPFDVVAMYTTSVDVMPGASGWDESGRVYALDVDADTAAVSVHRLTMPAGATGSLTDDVVELAQPADRFDPSYLNYPAVVSLPGNEYLLSYTSTAVDGVVPGLAYLFAGNVQKSRAFSNGIFHVAGAVRADATRHFFTAFSGYEAAQSSTNVGGLYVADVRGQALTGADTQSFLLAATGTDSSGPVAKDASGTLVIATQGAATNVRAISRCAALEATTALDPAVLHTYDETGTQSLAVIPPTATQTGFFVHLAYVPFGAEPGTPAHSSATAFTRTGDTFAIVGEDIETPVAIGPDSDGLNIYADEKGYLWITVQTDDGSRLLKLRRRAS